MKGDGKGRRVQNSYRGLLTKLSPLRGESFAFGGYNLVHGALRTTCTAPAAALSIHLTHLQRHLWHLHCALRGLEGVTIGKGHAGTPGTRGTNAGVSGRALQC